MSSLAASFLRNNPSPGSSQNGLEDLGNELWDPVLKQDPQALANLRSLGDLARQSEWRRAIGESKVFDLALQVLRDAGDGSAKSGVLEQALRLIGNCVADTDEVRAIFISSEDNLRALLRILQPPEVGTDHLALSVLYNICLDYEPAQRLLASSDGLNFLINSGLALNGNSAACELIQILSALPSGADAVDDKALLNLLQTCGTIDDPDSLTFIVNAATSILSTSGREAFLKHTTHIQAYANMVGDVYNLVLQFGGANLAEFADEYSTSVQAFYMLIGKLYELSAADSFKESPSSAFVQDLIQKLNDIQSIRSTQQPGLTAQCSVYYIVLGNMVRDNEFAVAIAEGPLPVLTVVHIKKASRSQDKVLSPTLMHATLQLLGQMAIASINRPIIVENGAFEALVPVLRDEKTFSEEVLIDALTVTRRLIAGSPKAIEQFDDCNGDGALNGTIELFSTTSKGSVKLEIGRLVAEICRTLGIDSTSSVIDLLAAIPNLAEPLGFVVVNAQSSGAKTEGWFAIGVMSAWAIGRPLVIRCFEKNEDVRSALEKASSEHNQADVDNVRVILNHLAGNSSSMSSICKNSMRNAAENAGLESLEYNDEESNTS